MTGAGECDRTWEGEITWSAIMWHVQDNQDIRASPHGLMVLANLISFYDKVSSLVDQRMAGDVAYQHFRKELGTVSHSICLGETACGFLFPVQEKPREHLQDGSQSIITNQALVPWCYSSVDCLSQGQFIRTPKG